ncbi:MAG: GGDEF domain-containing protein [Gammaproteobacteria bacterium]|jgi:GGDEF domain-containing protein
MLLVTIKRCMANVNQFMDGGKRWDQKVRDVESIPGILDESTLQQLLDVEVARARRYEHPFALLRVRVLDSGVLRDVAGALRLHIRWADSIGVLDDSNLLVILRDTPSEGARTVAAKILDSLTTELPVGVMHEVQLQSAVWRKGDDRTRLLSRLD